MWKLWKLDLFFPELCNSGRLAGSLFKRHMKKYATKPPIERSNDKQGIAHKPFAFQ